MPSLVGKNALTVFLSESTDNNLKMFFCPYTRNNVVQYTGSVEIIYPGYDSIKKPNVIIRPQKLSQNINYIFTNTRDREVDYASFWIQYRTFDVENIHTYHCFNCQAPQLYFSDNKVVKYDNKSEVKHESEYLCSNCKRRFKYMGMVSIGSPDV